MEDSKDQENQGDPSVTYFGARNKFNQALGQTNQAEDQNAESSETNQYSSTSPAREKRKKFKLFND